LTESGRVYYERCTAVMQALEEAESMATELHTEPLGRLQLTLPTAMGASYLMGPLAEFKARYPKLILDATFTDRHVDLLAEGFDLAIRAGDLKDTSLLSRRIATADMVLCASETYLARRGAPGEPEDLTRHECLLY